MHICIQHLEIKKVVFLNNKFVFDHNLFVKDQLLQLNCTAQLSSQVKVPQVQQKCDLYL